MTQLTENERALLRHLALDVGNCIADPEYGVQHLRDSHGQGGGHGFTYRLGPTAIVGTNGYRLRGTPVTTTGRSDGVRARCCVRRR